MNLFAFIKVCLINAESRYIKLELHCAYSKDCYEELTIQKDVSIHQCQSLLKGKYYVNISKYLSLNAMNIFLHDTVLLGGTE